MARKKKENRWLEMEENRWMKVDGAPADSEMANAVELPAGEWFAKFKEDVLDHNSTGRYVDGIFRNTVRGNCQSWTHGFVSLPV